MVSTVILIVFGGSVEENKVRPLLVNILRLLTNTPNCAQTAAEQRSRRTCTGVVP